MAQPVTVYRWDDPGAPQIVERRPSELIAILKKCLVEGYGAKAPLGWSVLFEDAAAHKIILQNSTAAGGSGGVLRVNTGNAGNAVDANTFFTPAKAATDIDTLFQAGHRHRGFYATTRANRWVVIGTATAFYLIVSELAPVVVYGSVVDFTGFFGDFLSVLPNDAGRFIVFINKYSGDNGSSLGNYQDSWTESFHSITYDTVNNAVNQSNGRLLLRNADGSSGTRLYNVVTPNYIEPTSSPPPLPLSSVGFYYPVLVTMKSAANFMNASARDDAGNILPGSQLSPVFRGFMPGLTSEAFPRYYNQQWPVTELLQGHRQFLVRSFICPASLWINMEEWQ